MSQKLPIHRLPLPATTLQYALPQLPLPDSPSAQRRSRTFPPATSGVWARVNPLWACWPPRISKAEADEIEAGLDGREIELEDVLKRWDPIDDAGPSTYSRSEDRTTLAIDKDLEAGTSGRTDLGQSTELSLISSERRLRLSPVLLGVSPATLRDSLPHLDSGDAVELCAAPSNSKNHPDEDGTDAGSIKSGKEARDSFIDVLSGRKVLMSSNYGPFSTRYCGHQFGSWAGQLGDGRAISILETTSQEGGRQEIQLKGAGRTPFSRTADGLAVLRSGVREFLGCEALAALGIPTTRALALLTHSSLPVFRENGPEPPSFLARVAPSFIRIGHFQALNPGPEARQTQFFFGGNWQTSEIANELPEKAALGGQGNLESLRDLTFWCMDLIGWKGSIGDWVREVGRRNAEMVALWQVYGWMHGVLNTDNISILGLTIDFGPYAFMDVYDPSHICNHSDPTGLYSYRNQTSRVMFAIDKLVSSVAPLIGYELLRGLPSPAFSIYASEDDVVEWTDKGLEVMEGWEKEFLSIEREAERRGWRTRFGLLSVKDTDDRLISDFLTLLHTHSLDFHATFRLLSSFSPLPSSTNPVVSSSYSGISAPQDTSINSKTVDQTSEMDVFLSQLETCLPTSTFSSVDDAKKAFVPWLVEYGKRIVDPAERHAWQAHTSPATNIGGDIRLEDMKQKVEEDGWIVKRRVVMDQTNPRFVLRQWVLEEVIGVMENCGEGEEDKSREALSNVLDVSILLLLLSSLPSPPALSSFSLFVS
ncbi:hypothetical protein M231_07980 [Tremella mesenterica]|uniref:Selenoprotein O n=1 Tax=Tremella mesenterica TaxID=5217 RepID=A0A4Q1B7U9_TREME|nr:hypothetical protein M231_07980 [Tremella mesenterica]